ncbi:MAG TPA: glycosyltransferase family 87 protein, partial [Candidatus Dormibacteraeota bacterium]|nr:glycosyltransferase family 87 protein [Candidatus Dormibacteraeota bacterium]
MRPGDDARVAVRRSPLADPKVAVAIWVVALVALASIAARLPARANQNDFSHYYTSALLLREGVNPYRADLRIRASELGLNVGDNVRATYPPTFLLCFEPLTFLNPGPAYWTWIALNAVAMAVALAMLLGPRSHLDVTTALSLAGFAILFPAFADNFGYAQSQALVLLLLVLAMRSLQSGMDRAAGAVLAIAVLLRIFPIIMFGYLVMRRRWRALTFAIASLAIGAGITIALVGLRTTLDFREAIAFVTSSGRLTRPANIALHAFIARLFIYSAGLPLPKMLNLARQLIEVVSELALLAMTVLISKTPTDSTDSDARVFSVWIVTTILLAPTAWLHYLVLLFIPYAQIVSATASGRASSRTFRMTVASYFVLTGLFFILDAMHGELPHTVIA